jgi:hypothetical protein
MPFRCGFACHVTLRAWGTAFHATSATGTARQGPRVAARAAPGGESPGTGGSDPRPPPPSNSSVHYGSVVEKSFETGSSGSAGEELPGLSRWSLVRYHPGALRDVPLCAWSFVVTARPTAHRASAAKVVTGGGAPPDGRDSPHTWITQRPSRGAGVLQKSVHKLHRLPA